MARGRFTQPTFQQRTGSTIIQNSEFNIQNLDIAVVSPRVVGRAPHVDLLRVLVDQVAEERTGRAALLAGEAGIGKSRLVSEARAMAEQRGLFALQGNCFETDRTLPYAPVLDLLRSLLTSHSLL